MGTVQNKENKKGSIYRDEEELNASSRHKLQRKIQNNCFSSSKSVMNFMFCMMDKCIKYVQT